MDSTLNLVILALASSAIAALASEPACSEGWTPFHDQKCYKVIRTYSNWEAAEKLCNDDFLNSEIFYPTLANIKSADEQEFLSDFVFNVSQVEGNVWIGGTRTNEEEFQWTDGSMLGYSNWAVGNPTLQSGRNCVEMLSTFGKASLSATVGTWQDVACAKGNYVVCQKEQTWSMQDLIRLVLELRQQSGVPLGFIYTQLPGQPDPTQLWPRARWVNISSEYAGLFFRTEDGEANVFDGSIQVADSPRLVQVETIDKPGGAHWGWFAVTPGTWSAIGRTGEGSWDSYGNIGTRFLVSNVETRPVNKAVRLWKRVG